MAGHSKWNNIKNKKGATDAKKAQIFTNLVKNIRIAAKSGGDPNTNPTLRLWVEKAKEANMPKDKIQRAIEIGCGKFAGDLMQEVVYEAFGPGGVAMMIMTVTNNANRMSGEIKALLNRSGGSMGGPGSAQYLFTFDKQNQEYHCTMPMDVDSNIREQLVDLKNKLFEIEGIEGVFFSIS